MCFLCSLPLPSSLRSTSIHLCRFPNGQFSFAPVSVSLSLSRSLCQYYCFGCLFVNNISVKQCHTNRYTHTQTLSLSLSLPPSFPFLSVEFVCLFIVVF